MYIDGKPKSCNPAPCAGNLGTIVKIEDLFYNVPSRKRAFFGKKKETEEYNKILFVVQRYAIHMSRDGVTFVCRKVGGNNSDLNTQSISSVKAITNSSSSKEEGCCKDGDKCNTKNNNNTINNTNMETAMKDTIGHIFGTFVARELLTLECAEGDIEETNKQYLNSYKSMTHDDQKIQMKLANDSKLTFKAYGLLSNVAYCVPKSSAAFILFINNRLVECSSIKRVLEGIYAESLPRGVKPFIYLSLELPGPHIDVNVHPTKREVALLHEDLLCQSLYVAVRNVLCSATSSRTFYTQTLIQPQKQLKTKDEYEDKKSFMSPIIEKNENVSTNRTTDSPTTTNNDNLIKVKSEFSNTTRGSSSKKRPANFKQSTPDKKLVRINHAAPVGALEPFLTQQHQLKHQSQQEKQQSSQLYSFEHDESCPLYNTAKSTIDLTQPGAFTKLCRCKLNKTGKALNTTTSFEVQQAGPPPRPKKVIPSECSYSSIKKLRNDIIQQSHREIATKLRDSAFVGCMSKQRSIIQCGINLLMINHHVLSKQLFYQLALAKFGNAHKAKFSNPIDVKRTIAHMLRLESKKGDEEESMTQIKNTTEWELAEQATQCLIDHVQMLEDYFSFSFKVQNNMKEGGDDTHLFLTGLPILLEGHEPCPHALPLFLLRLATEVNWEEESSCFKDICTELGAFYAQLPYDDDDEEEDASSSKESNKLIGDEADKRIRHILYPAISFLLVPHKDLADDGSIVKLAMLPSLYKIFERC